MTDNLSRGERLLPETLGFQVLSLRQSLPAQQSPGPFGTAEKPRKRGLLCTKLLTAASTRNAVLVSLSLIVSKAADFAILVRNFKRLILMSYSAREVRTFRIPPVARRVLRSNRDVDITETLGDARILRQMLIGLSF